MNKSTQEEVLFALHSIASLLAFHTGRPVIGWVFCFLAGAAIYGALYYLWEDWREEREERETAEAVNKEVGE